MVVSECLLPPSNPRHKGKTMQVALLQSVLSTGVTLAAKAVTSVVGQMPATYHADLMERPDLVQWNCSKEEI